MLEVDSSYLDMMMNPAKHMEAEIQKIIEEEKARNEAEDLKNGKPLDIQTYELIQKEREVRLSSRIEDCRAKWADMKGYT